MIANYHKGQSLIETLLANGVRSARLGALGGRHNDPAFFGSPFAGRAGRGGAVGEVIGLNRQRL
jgi:hypothetical protein